MNSTWWAVARSEEVSGTKPLAVDIEDQPIVLWRDAQGCARALEDRCPHRRAPLSLGCIRKEGWIQCGYHGWSYDGETGRVREIPNLKTEQRFSSVFRAQRFAVHEAAGFVRIAMDAETAPPQITDTDMPLSGTTHLSLEHGRYLATLFDDPSLLFTIFGVHFTSYLMSELREQHGRLVMERSCQWKLLHWPAAFSSDYPLYARTTTDPVTGETELGLRDRDNRLLLSMILAPVPAARGVTAVRWRAKVGEGAPWPARILRRFNPVTMHQSIDGAVLRMLNPSVSSVFEKLRSSLQMAPLRAA